MNSGNKPSEVAQAMEEKKVTLPMLTTSDFNKRVTSKNLGLKPGLACSNCLEAEVLIDNPNIITKDPNGPRYMVAKCPKCKHVCKIYTRN